MKKIEKKFKSTSGKVDIRYVVYKPEKPVKAILQIAHGMQEFIDRYEEFAEYMCKQGYLVTGNDHLGHGGSVNSEEDFGYFADKDGNGAVLNDVYELTKIIKKEYPDKPYFLLGHSMGSFYARQYLCHYGNELNAAIIMGTGHQSLATVKAGMFACSLFALIKGWHYRSSIITNMAMGSYNKHFEPVRTRADWLSRDTERVDKYISEPRCSFMFTLNGFYNMFKGISLLHDTKLLNSIPKQLPILFVSGEDDPVGDFTKGVISASDSLKKIGCHNVDVKFYPNDRHEILGELDKEQVFLDIYNWLENSIRAK